MDAAEGKDITQWDERAPDGVKASQMVQRRGRRHEKVQRQLRRHVAGAQGVHADGCDERDAFAARTRRGVSGC